MWTHRDRDEYTNYFVFIYFDQAYKLIESVDLRLTYHSVQSTISLKEKNSIKIHVLIYFKFIVCFWFLFIYL